MEINSRLKGRNRILFASVSPITQFERMGYVDENLSKFVSSYNEGLLELDAYR